MQVYVVMFDGAYGAQIDKIFTSKAKADTYVEEKQKSNSIYNYYIETHWAI
jgi:hypothetical protein